MTDRVMDPPARRRTNDSTGRESSLSEWTRTLEVDCAPIVDRFVDEVDVHDVKNAVTRYWPPISTRVCAEASTASNSSSKTR